MSAPSKKPRVLLPSSELFGYEELKSGYKALGFNDVQAGSLARKRDLLFSKVKRAVMNGCSIDLAVKIFL